MTRFMRWWTLAVSVLFLFAACATLGIGRPDSVQRWLASVGCVAAVTAAIGEVAGDPSLDGAKSVLAVVSVINKVAASDIPSTVLTACKDDIAHVAEDAAAAATVMTASTGTDQPKAAPPKMARAPRAQPTAPTPVNVPVPKKQ